MLCARLDLKSFSTGTHDCLLKLIVSLKWREGGGGGGGSCLAGCGVAGQTQG